MDLLERTANSKLLMDPRIKVPTGSLLRLSKARQPTYTSLIGSLFTWEFILDGIMEIRFLNVHFIATLPVAED